MADAATLLAQMAEAGQACILTEFKDRAHDLRSSAANIGALRLHKMLIDLREIDKPRLEAEGADIMRALDGEFARVREFFADHLGKTDAAAKSFPPAAE